jgi:hypothetical protein
MTHDPSLDSFRRRRLLFDAASDFYYLQNHRYPRTASLDLVGNRYALPHAERQLLHRGVFGQEAALARRARRSAGAAWREKRLVVDGCNVQITVESGILQRKLLLANDGAMRDIAGQSAQFRMSEASEIALDMIFRFLDEHRPKSVLFLYDAPMSHSGALADRVRRRLRAMGLPGEARTSPSPDSEMPLGDCVVASSDYAILDKSTSWLDLARQALDCAEAARPFVSFETFVRSTPPEFHDWLRSGDEGF